MAIQIVMDHNGDTRHYFDPNDADALAKAEERFKELTAKALLPPFGLPLARLPRSARSIQPPKKRCFFPQVVGG